MSYVCPDCLGEIADADAELCASCGVVRPNAGWLPDPLTGLILSGRYRLESRLGTGGMATVFRASRMGALGGAVAVKLLAPRLARTVIAKRFEREALVVSRLTNPYIVRIYDFDTFKLPGRDDGLYYFAMELVEGTTLASTLRKQGRVNFLWGIDILRQVARGLDEAHAQGIVHRDLKPSNIMLQQQRAVTHVKILDFGIAALAESTSPGASPASAEKLTQTGFISGTPDYMAPEQAVGDPHIGPPADIYALGLIAFEMFSGQRAFSGGNTIELLLARVTKPAPRLEDVASPELPRDLFRIVDKMLQREAKDRYQSAGELLDELARFPTLQTSPDFVPPAELIKQYGTAASQPVVATLTAERAASTRVAAAGVERPKKGVGAWVWIVVVLVLGGVGAAVAVLATGDGTTGGPATTAPPTVAATTAPATVAATTAPAATTAAPIEDVAVAAADVAPPPTVPPETAAPTTAAPIVRSVVLGGPRPPLEAGFSEVPLAAGAYTVRLALPTTAPPLFAPLPLRVAIDRGADALRATSGVLALTLLRDGQDAGRAEGLGRDEDGRLAIALPPRPMADVYTIVLSVTLADGAIVPLRLRYDANAGTFSGL